MRAKLTLALLLAPALASASGFEVINTNPRDLALSSSAVAAQEDAAATFANPSALSKLEGLNLSLAGSLLSLHTDWRAPSGSGLTPSTADTDFAPVPPVALYAAYGTKVADRGLGIGFGIGTPGGGQMRWEEDWAGRGRIIEVQRRVLGFYLNAGYAVLPWLRVGGGGIYYYGIQYLKQGIQPFEGAFAELSANGGGFAYQLSAEVQPLDRLTIGVDYKHKAIMKTEGDGNFEVPPALESAATADTNVKQDLPFPNVFNLGASYRVAKPWLVTLQYSFARFVEYENDTFIAESGRDPIIVPRDYRNGFTIRGGVEWDTTQKLTLRAGLMRDFSGLRARTLSPTLPDSNTTGASVGASYSFRPGLALNGAFFYGDRDRTYAADPAFPGSYKTTVVIASAGVTWAPGAGR
jgi:long-chain fatty acid transport protein